MLVKLLPFSWNLLILVSWEYVLIDYPPWALDPLALSLVNCCIPQLVFIC